MGYFWNDLSDDYSFPILTVIDGFLVDSTRYKDPQTGKLSKDKVEKPYTTWEKWFGGAYPLSFGEMIRYYLDQHLIVMNLINDALVRVFPGEEERLRRQQQVSGFPGRAALGPGGLEAAPGEPGGL